METMIGPSSQTLDAGLRLAARDAGFAAVLEAGFTPASEAIILDVGFLVVPVVATLETGLDSA
jgi:hypothetical protein